MNNKVFMFNPFDIGKATDKQIEETYINMKAQLADDRDNPFLIVKDIEVYANLRALVGEMLARYKNRYNDLKLDLDTLYSIQIYTLRDEWIEHNEGKPPAMSYFEAMAKESISEEMKELNRYKLQVERFKLMFESIEQKINALKKRYESARFAIGADS